MTITDAAEKLARRIDAYGPTSEVGMAIRAAGWKDGGK